MKRTCSGDICKSKDIKSVPMHRYTDNAGTLHHRCLTCIPNNERQNFTPGRYELAIVNDVLGHLEKNNSRLDVTHNKAMKKGDLSRPDLLIRDKEKLIALEIDEQQHNRNKNADDERRKKLQKIAKDEGKELYDVRFIVNEHKQNPVVEKIGYIVYKNDGYDQAVQYTSNKIQKIKEDKSNTQIVNILANDIKNMNISSSSCICGAIQKDGNKCTNKCKSNGRCGRHGG